MTRPFPLVPSLHGGKLLPRLLAAAAILAAGVTGAAGQAVGDGADDPALTQARELHRRVPLIDGHNDLPWQLRKRNDLQIEATDLQVHQEGLYTDIPRLRAGGVGGQFWSAYPHFLVDPRTALVHTLEAIDSVHTLVAKYPETFALALTADDIERSFSEGRIASLIGVEGGQVINHSLGVLRMLHQLGVRYLTLTHNRTHDWGDSATGDAIHGGLSEFGKAVVVEMNRLGMLVDLSHTSAEVMRDALDIARAPVLFSHSNAYALAQHPRNVPDAILDRIPGNGGLVMVTFVPSFTRQTSADWRTAREAHQTELRAGTTEVSMEDWEVAHPRQVVTLADVADHIDYLVTRIGADHVGIGGDFDGITELPVGLEDVSRYPYLTAELIRRGYAEEDLVKILGGNLLRVMRANERVAAAWDGD